MTAKDDLITVGEIVNTQGNKGEVKVRPLTDFPERYRVNGDLVLDRNGLRRHLTVEKVREHKNFFIVKFREIPDMNSAEEIKGAMLKITRDQLAELPEDTYFIFEIVGMEVQTEDGRSLGRIKEVVQTGSNDVYVVGGKTKDYLIPAVKEIIKNVDKSKRLIVINPLEGLLEL